MYQSCDRTIWTGRDEPELGEAGFLWHHVVEFLDLNIEIPITSGLRFAILGFESDEGVRRNNGRVGAKAGPNEIRKSLAKLAVHFETSDLRISDAGNVSVEGDNLEAGQAELAQKVSQLLTAGYFPILVGGGHEIAYGHGSGVLDYLDNSEIFTLGVINFDAHFDVRTYAKGAHSGSPFRQLMERSNLGKSRVKYFPIGINQSANQRALYEFMQKEKQSYISLEEVLNSTFEALNQKVEHFIKGVDHIYITLDLDAIIGAFAPGVSAPSAFGLSPEVVLRLLNSILKSNKVLSFDIAELNPTYDDGRTSRLAANIIYRFVMSGLPK